MAIGRAEQGRTHLTLTGYEAGRVICGARKDRRSDRFLHYAFAPIDKLQSNEILDYPPLCEKCMAIINEEESC
jgi:hypothetical protein